MSLLPPAPLLPESIADGDTGHEAQHEQIHHILNNLLEAGPFQHEPSATLAVRYAAPWGDDANDGLGWGSPKQYVMSAFDALPSAGGEVYFADNTRASATATDHGIWLAGTGDPNYSSLPAGWRQSKRVAFIGVGGTQGSQQGRNQAVMLGGSTTDGAKPAIALSVRVVNVSFENIASDYVLRPIRIGLMSDGTDMNTGYTCNTYWKNISPRVTGATAGPNISIVSTIDTQFWHTFEWMTGQTNNALPVTDDRRCFMRTSGTYLLTINHAIWTYGGLKFTTPNTSWNLRVNDLQLEGDFVNAVTPAVDVYGSQSAGFAYVSYVSIFDAPGTACTVRNNALPAESVITVGIGETGLTAVRGPHTNLGFERVTDGSVEASQSFGPTRWKDVARRNFGMAMTPAVAQLANHAPAAWGGRSHGAYPAGGNATVTTVTGFNGVPNAAGRLTWAGGAGTYGNREVAASLTLAVGDFIAYGVWVNRVTAGEDSSTGPSLTLATAGFTANKDLLNVLGAASSQFISANPATFGIGNRPSPTFYTVVCRVTAVGTNPCNVVGEMSVSNGETTDYQGPVLYQFPAASWTAERVASFVNAMHSAPYLPNLLADDGNGGDLVAQFGARPVFPGSYLVVADQDTAAGGFFGTPLGSGVFYKAAAGHYVSLAAAGVFAWLMQMRTQSATGDRLSFKNDNVKMELSSDAADGQTEMLLTRNIGGTKTLQRVSMGAADSGGAGFKTLRVPN